MLDVDDLELWYYFTSSTRTRRGGSCLKDIYIYKTFLIYRTCMRRAPAKRVRACILRKWGPVSHVTFEAPLRTSHFSLHSSHSTLHTSHCTLRTPHFISHCTLKTPHFTLHTSHFTVHASHFSLLTAFFTLHTSHCTVHAPRFTLHSSHLHFISTHLIWALLISFHVLHKTRSSRRKFRSETSDNMDSWKAEVRRVRRDKIRRKKMQVREKVGTSWNTASRETLCFSNDLWLRWVEK